MITLAQLKTKANNQYQKVLKAVFLGEDIFPLLIATDKRIDKS